MQLFQMPPQAEVTCTPEQGALAARDTLLATATSIQAVRSPEDNQQCAAVGSEMQKLVKGVESARKDLTAPYLAAQRSIKATADAFCEPITKALARLGNGWHRPIGRSRSARPRPSGRRERQRSRGSKSRNAGLLRMRGTPRRNTTSPGS